jgi:hypothetical protein
MQHHLQQRRLPHGIYSLLILLVITFSQACSSAPPYHQEGLSMLRDFAHIPAGTPVTVEQAKRSLAAMLPHGSTNQAVLAYIKTKDHTTTPCYWNDDETQLQCSLLYYPGEPYTYRVTFLFDNAQTLSETEIYHSIEQANNIREGEECSSPSRSVACPDGAARAAPGSGSAAAPGCSAAHSG